MRASADEEDAIEKLPVTPGPIVPAREQLGYLLLEQNQPALALKEFRIRSRKCARAAWRISRRGTCRRTL